MSKIRYPDKVKLFAGLIGNSETNLKLAEEFLSKEFGKIDLKSPTVAFTFTDYYSEEMGQNLLRRWIGFENLIGPEELSKIKSRTNEIEKEISGSPKRIVNIDPGYIDHAKVVLASTKDFSHRIYLSEGVFGEITMIYKHKEYAFLPWTYPDYKSEPALHFFQEARAIFHNKSGEL